MANRIYNYSSSYGAPDPYLPEAPLIGSSRYLSSHLETTKYSTYSNQSKIAGGIGASSAYAPKWASVDAFASASAVDPTVVPGMKRSTEALYHQTILGTHSTSGQSEALFSMNSLAKRSRLDTASNLPIYPQRPGEKDCAYYMLTRTCKFGETCKFDHPLWVPEGGIPDWKEVPLINTSEALPERPGEPDCPYYMKTQKCKFGLRCKFNHPKGEADAYAGSEARQAAESTTPVLPERPSEPICSFYARTGRCKFGVHCIYHHPNDLQILSSEQDPGCEQRELAMKDTEAAGGDSNTAKPFVPFTPALLHNSKGLPVRLGEPDCSFYLKTGSCKYAALCRFNHPEINLNLPAVVSLGHSIIPSSASNLHFGFLNPAANLLPNIDLHLNQASLAATPTIYPQRPGQLECDFYMKTGHCKFGERCKFHHPINQSASTVSLAKQSLQQNVKLTLAGLPRREGTVACPYYMKTGACKFGVACRFDHPPPGEAIAMSTVQVGAAGTGTLIEATTTGGEKNHAAGTAEDHQ